MNEFIVEYPYFLALLIFFARVADVSLGTFRTIVIFRGYKLLSAMIGFIEIINKLDRNAVYTVSDLKSVYEGPDFMSKSSFWNLRKTK